jgi:hypothetical protein
MDEPRGYRRRVADTIRACLTVAIFPSLMPWRYIVATFARAAGDRWR